MDATACNDRMLAALCGRKVANNFTDSHDVANKESNKARVLMKFKLQCSKGQKLASRLE